MLPSPSATLIMAAKTASFDMGKGDLASLTSGPVFTDKHAEQAYIKERLAAALRIFADQGFDHTIAGHLTVRDPVDPSTFWVNPFGLAFALMTVSDLIRVDHAGNVVEGGRPGRQIVNLAGFTIHHAIHVARPDVLAICHSHSTYGKAYATLGKPLEITTQDSCSFYNDVAHLADFGGVVIESKESASITDALGAKKAIILQSHGLLTVGGSIESAVAWFIMLEKQCEVALLADAAAAGRGGKVVPIDEPQAAFTYKEVGSERAGYFQASPYFQVIEHKYGKEYKQ